jgi:hypothetical protein
MADFVEIKGKMHLDPARGTDFCNGLGLAQIA